MMGAKMCGEAREGMIWTLAGTFDNVRANLMD
jgi:hypothetical protein